MISNTYLEYKHNLLLTTINQTPKTMLAILSIAIAFGLVFAAVAPMQAFAVTDDDGVKLLKSKGCKGGSEGFKSSDKKCHNPG
jgi:hypothetical protein